MASSQVEVEDSYAQLKHLDFVRVLAINAAVIISKLYDSAKQNSGAYKSTFDKAETAVTAVFNPVIGILKGVPSNILVFLDKKVDHATHEFAERASPAAKNLVSKTQFVARKAFKVAHELAAEATAEGPLATISRVGAVSKRAAVSQMAVVWYKANKHPALHSVFQMATPAATHGVEKYNEVVVRLRAKGFTLSGYVPLVPIVEFSKAYKQVEVKAAEGKEVDSGSSSDEGESGKETETGGSTGESGSGKE